MLRIEWRDFIGGVLLLAFGLYFVATALGMSVGTASRMGPGYFPLLAGGILLVLAMVIIGQALVRAGPLPRPEWRPFFSVCAAIVVFAIAMDYLGLLPAIFAGVIAASIADPRSRPLQTLLLAAGLCAGAWLVFIYALRLPMQAQKVFL